MRFYIQKYMRLHSRFHRLPGHMDVALYKMSFYSLECRQAPASVLRGL